MVSAMETLARVGEAIQATTRKLEKTRLLAEYLVGLDDATLPVAAIFFNGHPFADRDQRKLNLGYAVMRDAIMRLGQVDEQALGDSYLRHRDIGDVIEEILAGHTHPVPTSLADVLQTFIRIYEQRTVKKKTDELAALLDRLSPLAS